MAVLHYHGIDVYVPPGQVGCGVAPLARGDVETAHEAMTRNLPQSSRIWHGKVTRFSVPSQLRL